MKPERKIISILLVLCLVAGLLPTVAFAAEPSTPKAIMLGIDHLTGGQASSVYFGRYQQTSAGSTQPSEGTSGVDWIQSTTAIQNSQGGYYYRDPIKWRVLANADGKLFLLSDQNLDVQKYHEDYESVTWEKSTMRSWLNGYAAANNDGGDSGKDYSGNGANFIGNAFSTGEQSAIVETSVTNATNDYDTNADPNPSYSTSGGSNTTDKIFLLSIAQANNSSYFADNDSRKATNTAFVYGGGQTGTSSMYVGAADYWWLRSRGYFDDYAANVLSNGGVSKYGYIVYYGNYAVRPAFNLNLTSVLFTSAAAGGKSSGAAGAGTLAAVSATDTTEWKLTLLDSNRNFTVTETTATVNSTNSSAVLTYSNAAVYNETTTPNEYISAMIVNESGEVLYYGRVAQPSEASGTVSITIPSNLADGTYTLKVFSEQYNGDKMTDYASNFSNVALTVDRTAPTVSGSAVRGSDAEATVTFTSSEEGQYYCSAVVESVASAPTIETTGAGTNCDTSAQTISLSGLTAGAKDIYIIVKDTAGNVSNAQKIEIPVYVPPVSPVYSISADTSIVFDAVQTGYTQPAAKTVTIRNTGNQSITLTQPTAKNYTVGTLSGTDLAAGNTATFTVQPNTGLGVGTYSEMITVTGTNGTSATISVTFTVQSSGGGGYTPPTYDDSDDDYTPPAPKPQPETGESGGWDEIQDELRELVDEIDSGDVPPGGTVEVDMNGATEVPGEVLEEIAGKDINVEFDMGGGVSWTVNGQDIPADIGDLDLGISTGGSSIPVNVFNSITGETSSVQLELSHDGAFGATLYLSVNLGEDNRGFWANLYYFNEALKQLVFHHASRIEADGRASWPFDHASSYAIVIDDENHNPDWANPFTDVTENDWFYSAVEYVNKHGLMAGTSATLFSPDLTTSRGMIAAILYRQEGEPTISGANPFTDVAEGKYYHDAIIWAEQNGIVGGYGGGLYGPDDPITREQLAAILWRYAKYKGYDVSVGESTNILSYKDFDRISEYAIPAMQWACGEGIMGGYDGNLMPADSAKRSHAAAMLTRFFEKAMAE